MRQLSHFAIISLICVCPLTSRRSSAAPPLPVTTPSAPVECSSHYNGRYPNDKCFVQISRDNPASPLAVVVPKGTTIIVRVVNTRALESITFDEKTSKIDKPDAFSTFIQSALDPLKSFVSQLVRRPGGQQAMEEEIVEVDDPLYKSQLAIQKQIDAVRSLAASAAKEVTCLAAYQPLDTTPATYRCDVNGTLTSPQFLKARDKAVCDIQGGDQCTLGAYRAGIIPLPLASEQASAGKIAKTIGDIAKGTVDIPAGKENAYNVLLSNEQRLQVEIKDLQDAQKALLLSASILSSIPASVDVEITRKQDKDTSTTITVTATNQISKTAVQLGMASVTWQTTPWKVSTGLMFSALPNHAFANAPQILNGQPVLDSGGKVTTIVTETTTRPTIVFPLVMANYRAIQWRSCSRFCAVYASGGVGVSLANSTTEFAAGPSLQWGAVLLSPLVHVGRVQYLSNGVQVGQLLGSSPPALPTEKRWSVSAGFGISYIIPFK